MENTEIATTDSADQSAMIASLVLEGDLSKMSKDQKVLYYNSFCKALELNPLTQPFEIINLKGKLRMYATKACTEQLRRLNGISVTDLTVTQIGEIYTVTAKGTDKSGRVDASTASLTIKGLTGEALGNAMMKAETKAKRRLTLSMCGLGILDESEIESISQSDLGSVANTESNPNATPNAPAQDALATDEDFKELFELINNPIIANIEKYHSNNNLTPTAFTAALVKIQEGNTGLEKSKAEGYIKFLKDEVAYWTTQQPKVEMATTAQVLELMELFADPNLGEVLTVKNGKGELLSKDAFKNALTKMADDKKLTAQQCKAYHDIISKEIEFAKSAK